MCTDFSGSFVSMFFLFKYVLQNITLTDFIQYVICSLHVHKYFVDFLHLFRCLLLFGDYFVTLIAYLFNFHSISWQRAGAYKGFKFLSIQIKLEQNL